MFSSIVPLLLAAATALAATGQPQPATLITGRVICATNGHPVPGAMVYVEPVCAPGTNCFTEELPTVVSAPDGSFSLEFQALADEKTQYTCWVYVPEGWLPAAHTTAIPVQKHAANTVTFSVTPDTRPQALTRSVEEE